MSSDSPRETAPTRVRRNRAPWVLAGALVLLVAYYVIVAVTGALNTSTKVPISGGNAGSGSYVTLQMKVQDVDLTNRVMLANLLPVPHGDFVGARAGEMSTGLRIEISSGGITTSVVAYPGESIVDPTAINLALDRGDTAYPLDQPFANFQLNVHEEETGDAVPFVLTIENSARPWVMQAAVDQPLHEQGSEHYPVTIEGTRDALTVALVVFYLLAILLTTLMAVVTIGGAILNKDLGFENVIWLSATMLSFPALRSAMPDAPPIGTALDFIILFPCIALVAIMLVWTGAHLLWRESSVLRRRMLEEPVGLAG